MTSLNLKIIDRKDKFLVVKNTVRDKHDGEFHNNYVVGTQPTTTQWAPIAHYPTLKEARERMKALASE